ncbi:ribonuclease-3 [Rhizobium sp. SG_E_25_P2]|jgi:ribonuclease III|uniref:ribonuclease III n=1 Tax=Rhizobium sp. SG_E_25_P2 TaxID=2879942 RepID=UPI00247379C2|nr:ribonuclease III [Rhizobium sp. SG_E_25_P2]MDH6266876.1 ribonuclease-3 [Rhizobium sp. SG_E_25_P2]
MSRKSVISPDERDRLEALIGYGFNDKNRLERAMTHSSARLAKGGNYERLEFLGDRVLGLCIAELLFTTYKTAAEGELSVRLNKLVSADACAEVADEMELHRYIRTGADLKKITGERMKNVRADVVESLIAAIYLDGGLEAARGFVLRQWSGRATRSEPMRRDAKTELQEWAHQKFGFAPTYRIEDRSGPDHAPEFTVTVEIGDLAPEKGVDRSKRAAEQVAARKMLEREGVWAPQPELNGLEK